MTNIITLNCKSLTASKFQSICNWAIINKLAILLLQEARIDVITLSRCSKSVGNFDVRLCCPSSSKGGVITIVNNKLAGFTNAYEDGVILRDENGRLLVTEITLQGRNIIVGNIYCPASEFRWAHWVRMVTDALPEPLGCHIVGEDWNQTLFSLDRTSRRIPSKQVQDLFPKLLDALSGAETLVDADEPDLNYNIQFSHMNPNRGASRIDRLYIPLSYSDMRPQISYWSAPIFTDHKAVVLTLQLKSRERGPGRWRLDPLILKHPYTRCLRVLAEQGWTEWKSNASDFLKIASKRRKNAGRNCLLQIRRRRDKLLRRNSVQLNQHILRSIRRLDIKESEVSQCINKEFVYKVQAKNAVLGEKPNKWFFQKMSDHKPSGIDALWKTDGTLTSSPAEMLLAVKTFWEPMYGHISYSGHSLNLMLDSWETRLSSKAHRILSMPIERKEVCKAITKLRYGKTPGFDGLPGEFYRYMMASMKNGNPLDAPIVRMLTHEFNRVWEGGKPDSSWYRGCLSLLYKKGDAHDCANYRPLIMLNVDHKIFTSIIASRFAIAMPEIIGPEQGAFLPGRLIDDNIRRVQITIDFFESQNTGASLLFLDLEKGYDMVSQEALWVLMAYVRVPDAVISCIKHLYEGANITPVISGHWGEVIPRHRGLHQGDPLSCMLYLFVIEIGACALRSSNQIEGLIINGELLWKVLMYADDTVVLVRNQSEADEVIHIFSLFEEALGQRVNWTKSFLLAIGNAPPIQIPHAKNVNGSEYFTYLGVPVGRKGNDGPKETWHKALAKMKSTQTIWSKAHLSLSGRVLIANTLIMSIPRFLLKFLPPPARVMQDMERIYWKMVWDGKKVGLIKRETAIAGSSLGGLGCQDLKSIMAATVIATVQRARDTSPPLWSKLITQFFRLKQSRTKSVRRDLLTDPLFQLISNRPIAPPPSMSYTVNEWRKLMVQARNGERGPIEFLTPKTEEEFNRIKFWYHPMIDVTVGVGARRFASKACVTISSQIAYRIESIL